MAISKGAGVIPTDTQALTLSMLPVSNSTCFTIMLFGAWKTAATYSVDTVNLFYNLKRVTIAVIV